MSLPPIVTDKRVALARSAAAAYACTAPFHPPERYPEFAAMPTRDCDPNNHTYAAVRDALALLFGPPDGPKWNPLAQLIQPGDTVVLKPNFIKEHHETRPSEWEQVITHGAVIRAVCDYVLHALDGHGRVVICDAPQTDSSFAATARVSGAEALVRWYASWSPVPVVLLDLRREEWEARNDVIIRRRSLPGDPHGYVPVNLGRASRLHGITPPLGFYGADYDTSVTRAHHHGDTHEYLLSGTVMHADVVINLPKLKTHKKTGITCALKNLVGINGDKNWLPHYMLGAPEEGGDQFPRATAATSSERVLMSRIKTMLAHAPVWINHLFRPVKALGTRVFGSTHRVVRSGNWHGNDTAWRMAVDLNTCFFYWRDGDLSATPRERYLAVVDAIVAGEGAGPLAPDAKPCGVVIAGRNPVAVDSACAGLMGFDLRALRLLTGALAPALLPLCTFTFDDITLLSNDAAWRGALPQLAAKPPFHFTPHFGWIGAIER
jgi:uncharacterized protein (DUF362 family)